MCIFVPVFRCHYKEDTTWPSQTPGLNRSCFCGRQANRKDNIVSESETKPPFLKLGGLDAAGAAGEKSVIIVTKHRHCYPPPLRSFRSDDHNWFKAVKLSMIKFKELCNAAF